MVKHYLVILGFLAAGVFCLFEGVKDYRVSKQLKAQGQITSAEVCEKDKTYRRRGRSKCYLTVRYHTQDQRKVIARVEVPHAEYAKAEIDGTVVLRYLPDDPGVCVVGEAVSTPYEFLLYGAGFLAVTGLIWSRSDKPQDPEESARKILENTRAHYSDRHEYVPVLANDFRHLDLNWYDRGRKILAERGFVFLQDQENVTLTRAAKGRRTLLRVMLDSSGVTMACLYHFQPPWKLRLMGAASAKVLALETQFTDGSWVCTSNAQDAAALKSPPAIHSLHLARTTTMEFLLQVHAQRVAKYLADHPGLEPVRMHGIENVQQAQTTQERIKAEFRRETPISREELEGLAGPDNTQEAGKLHAEIVKLHEEEKRKAA